MKFFKGMLLLLVPLLLVSVAYATPLILASGKFETVNVVPKETKSVDGITFVTFTATFDLTGDFNGTFIEDIREVLKSTGKGTFQSKGTFNGTVNGASGSADIIIVGTIDGSKAQGQLVILKGTGGLANLRGRGSFNQIGNNGTYSAKIHFT